MVTTLTTDPQTNTWSDVFSTQKALYIKAMPSVAGMLILPVKLPNLIIVACLN
jgi:hypothetical protein